MCKIGRQRLLDLDVMFQLKYCKNETWHKLQTREDKGATTWIDLWLFFYDTDIIDHVYQWETWMLPHCINGLIIQTILTKQSKNTVYIRLHCFLFCPKLHKHIGHKVAWFNIKFDRHHCRLWQWCSANCYQVDIFWYLCITVTITSNVIRWIYFAKRYCSI